MFKVSQMAKDFGMKTKEVCTVIEESGISGKASSATMEPEEFNRFFDFITAENQIKNMDGYLNGQTVIKTPAAQAAAAEAAAEKAAAEKAAAEKAAAEKAAAEKAAAAE